MLRPFLQFFRPYRLRLIPIVLACALEMLFNAQVPLSVKFLIDRALLQHDRHMMVLILIALGVSTIVVSFTSFGRDYLYTGIVSRITAGLRQRMFERLQQLSLGYYSRVEVGDVMSRFSNDISVVENGLGSAVTWGLQPALDLMLSAALVFALEWRLATIGILLCPICVLGPRLLSKRATSVSVEKQQEESRLLSSLQETLSAPALVRAFNLQRKLIGTFRQHNESLVKASMRLGLFTALMERSASFGTLLLQFVVMGISGYMAYRGTITVGTFASFQALFVSLSYSVMYLAQYTPNLIGASGGLARIEQVLSEEAKVQDAPDAPPLLPISEAIELRDVSFSYSGERLNLDDVTLRVPRGWPVAFVGPSGSGKSTLLSLLLRFYDPDRGEVLFDGRDARAVPLESLRGQIAVVFQESFLFNTTIAENIALGRPDASMDEIVAAAKSAEIHDFIAGLPDGYQTIAGERGSRFSGGQRQRIAIARAVLRDPEILILDEATSALDPATEYAINETLERLAYGRTMISITHRLSSVVNMARIFLLENGRLTEQGDHQELLRQGGTYARMWQKQAGLQITKTMNTATVDAAWLAELPLMRGVPRETLEEVARWFVTEHFAEHRVIVQEGEPGNRFYILVRGTVEVTRKEGAAERRVARLQDGDYFGEIALLSDQPRTATVRTLTPCMCLSLQREFFDRLLAREPELRDHINRVSAARVSH